MTEEYDPFFISDEANEKAQQAPAEKDIIPGEEHGFEMVGEIATKPQERILVFAELGGLLRAATDHIIEGSRSAARKVEKKGKQFIIGTMIALGLHGVAAKPAEAIDWKRVIPATVEVGGRVGTVYFEHKAQRHAQAAEQLAEEEQRVGELADRVADIDGRIERATDLLKDPKLSTYQQERIQQDIKHMRYARAESLDELLWIQHQLDEAARKGVTARSEEQKARNNAIGAEISNTIEREASWANIWGW